MKHDPEQCSNCLAWLPSKDDPDAGSCRVSHPVVIPTPSGTQTMFPQTKPTTWCREYSQGATVQLPQSYIDEPPPQPGPRESYKELTGPITKPEPTPEPTAIVGRDATIPEPEAPIPPMPEVDVEKKDLPTSGRKK